MFGSREKVVGWILLSFGLLLILLSLVFIFLVFTGRTKPPEVMNVAAPSLELSSLTGSIELPPQLRAQGFSISQNDQKPAGQKIIPDDVFNFYINSGIFYLLMMFVASTGSKVAGIGVSLIKEIKVKVRDDNRDLHLESK